MPKKKTRLSAEDAAQVDRVHPERSFTGDSAVAVAEPPAPAPAAQAGAPDLESLLIDALVEVRSGRVEAAEESLRRFLSGRG